MELSKRGLQIYRMIDAHCADNLDMKEVDAIGLELLANCIDQYEKCNSILFEKGLTQTAPKTGFEVVRPEVGIAKDSLDKIIRLSDKFGLSPSARKKILGKVKQPDKKELEFDLD